MRCFSAIAGRADRTNLLCVPVKHIDTKSDKACCVNDMKSNVALTLHLIVTAVCNGSLPLDLLCNSKLDMHEVSAIQLPHWLHEMLSPTQWAPYQAVWSISGDTIFHICTESEVPLNHLHRTSAASICGCSA